MSIGKEKKNMARSLVLIGGKGPETLEGLKMDSYRSIIAADSGYDLAIKLGLEPDVVVGDLDSTMYGDILRGSGMHVSSVDKDESDFELALMSLEEDEEYDLLGGGEGRLDHTLSIFSSFIKYRPPRVWKTHVDYMVSFREADFTSEPGTEISIFPARLGSVCKVDTYGLVWNLSDDNLSTSFMSLSNRFESERISIKSTDTLFARFDNAKLDFSSLNVNIRIC